MRKFLLAVLMVALVLPAGFQYQMFYEDGSWDIYYENADNPAEYLWVTGIGADADYCEQGSEMRPNIFRAFWRNWRNNYRWRTGDTLNPVDCQSLQ